MKTAEAKQRLMDESVRLIDEMGLAGLSFREMSRRAGLSHQAPYHHFANREAILAAIVHEGFTRLDARLVEAQRHDRRKGAQQLLRGTIRAYMLFALDNPVHYRIMFRPELVNLPEYPEALAQAKSSFQRLVTAVAACNPNVAETDQQLIEVANGLWAAAHGVATLWLDGPLRHNTPGMSIASLIDAASEMFSRAGAQTARTLKKSAKDSPRTKPRHPGRQSARAIENRRRESPADRDAPR
ncbi:MAG TPA: TetR/AcrR family transcriptional regulator [Candidatus Binataceae bacterium]|nr:TetR/AcrR family transcriptional regulator [Candidatus Binataceae bacterium]